MALTLEGNGFSYALPSTVDLREITQRTRLDPASIVGRPGGIISPLGGRPDLTEYLISGYISGVLSGDLPDRFDELTEVLYSGELTLLDTDLSRRARVRLKTFAYQRISGSFGTLLRVSIRLAGIDGYAESLNPTTIARVLTPLSPAPATRNLVLDYAGPLSVPPSFYIALNSGVTWTPSVTWKGANLLVNPSFEEGATAPTGWVVDSGAPEVRPGAARSGERTAAVAAGDAWRQDVPVNGGATHTLSGYIRRVTSGAASITVEWRDASGVVVDTMSTTVTATPFWLRFILSGTSLDNTAVTARIVLGATSGTVEYDDVQFEEAASASAFSAAQHVTFTRDAALDYATGDRAWMIDMDRGAVLRTDATGATTADLDRTNGAFFELAPVDAGRQHLYFDPPTGGNLDVTVRYRERYY